MAGRVVSRPRKSPPAPPTELENELAFLMRSGFVSPAPGGGYVLTPDGRDWMLWALWQATGRPGMPAPTETEEGTS